MVACNTPVLPLNIAEAARPYASSREWSLLLEELVELEEILQEAAASPDQDAFVERADLERRLHGKRRALRRMDVAASVS